MNEEFTEQERLVRELVDPVLRADYARPYDGYRPGVLARSLGALLVTSGNLFYGKKPSYPKFKAIEVIARIPYQSWEVAAYTLLTGFYMNETRALRLSKTAAFSRIAQDNETMHVVVLSQITKRLGCCNFFMHTFIPLVFALFYFWAIYFLYIFSPKSSLELNYLFESHAYAQYQEFLDSHEAELKTRPITSEFLQFYGRNVRSEYELLETIRNDELIHRNRSIREIERLYKK